MDSYIRQAEELAAACQRAYASGLQRANGGNVSRRVEDGHMLVKGKGAAFCEVDVSDFVLTDLDGYKIEGKTDPTKESIMHGTIYKCCPEINAVVHVHAPYALAWSAYHDVLSLETWQAKLKITGDIPILNVESPVVRREDVPLLEEVLVSESISGGFILKNHGIVAIGRNVREAGQMAELLEETAKVAVLKTILSERQGKN